MTNHHFKVSVQLSREDRLQSKSKPSKHAKLGFSLNVDLALPTHGITAIFGASGSGKTTLLRCIAGLEQPTQGNIVFNNDVWQSLTEFLPTHKRPIGYVFQEASLFPHLTAQGNLDYAIKRADQTPSKELYHTVISVMGIDAILNQQPNQLSGGERQRIAIARALLIQPRLLLMDEPLASLDQARKQEILPYLEQLKTQFDIPILYVSHSMNEVARLADYAVTLDQGLVTAEGSLKEVFSAIDSKHNHTEDAGVILKGKVLERDSTWHLSKISILDSDEQQLWLKDCGEEIDQAVRIRVLAKDISIALNCHEDSSILNRLSVQIIEIAHDPDESMSRLRLRAGNEYLIARITNKSLSLLKLEQGMTVWAQIKSAAIVR